MEYRTLDTWRYSIAVPLERGLYFIPKSSTSKIRVALGGIVLSVKEIAEMTHDQCTMGKILQVQMHFKMYFVVYILPFRGTHK